MDARRRLTDDDGPGARARVDLDELAVAVDQAGGRVEQVEERAGSPGNENGGSTRSGTCW